MNTRATSTRSFAFRLKPKADLKKSILDFADQNDIAAGAITTCVGSLEQIRIRFANQKTSISKQGHFEIVSLVGTFSRYSCHLHIAVADENGHTLGGHLEDENLVYTTSELVITELSGLEFSRDKDDATGYHELVVKPQTKE